METAPTAPTAPTATSSTPSPRALGIPRGRVLMVQGTSSHAGKSTLVAALCRIFARDGWRVAPFKAQNMSLNSAVTLDGAEIGRAQMLQAQAARVIATADMNPILLKPQGERTSQIVVRGRVLSAGSVRDYYAMRDQLWPVVTGALDRLRAEHDLVVIEGAGSPAEINLRDRDIVNMRVALHANAPVLLVGDIERGGVFASLVGTMMLLAPEERALVGGLIVNKFRGDVTLFEPGPALLEQHTGVRTLGVLPYLRDVQLPDEDSLGLPEAADDAQDEATIDVAVVRLPHIANFDDFDPLRHDERVRVRYVTGAELGAPDLIVIPGSKTTMADLAWLREQGLAAAITAAHARGAAVLGICGGFQMLGRAIHDPAHVESAVARADGLGLLAVETRFAGEKTTHQARARVVGGDGLLRGCAGMLVSGYEIHMGDTMGASGSGSHAAFEIAERSGDAVTVADGAVGGDGWVVGTYLHGLLHNDDFRDALLTTLAARRGITLGARRAAVSVDAELDRLADAVESHLDMQHIRRLAQLERER